MWSRIAQAFSFSSWTNCTRIAVGRAQTLTLFIARLQARGAIPHVPVYLNSPMAIDATRLYHTYRAEHRLSAEEADVLTPFLAKHKVGYTVARDATGKLSGSFAVPAIPTIVVIDREGRFEPRDPKQRRVAH